ncbi:MAG: site-2 protease family protein, partial [Bacteroidota bacterium]
VAFAGPLGSFLLGGVFLLIITQLGGLPKLTLTAREAEVFPLFFTLGWGLLNLLPILPLDGGQILQNLLEYIPKINAEKIAAWVGVVVCSLLLIYVLMNFSLWNLMLVGMLLANNVQRLRSTGRIGTFVPAKKEAKTSTSRTEVDRMEDQFNLGFTDDALRLALNILEKTRNKKHRAAALKVAGRAYLKLGRLDEAEAFAANNPDFEEEVPELKIALMRYQGASKAAATFAEQAYASQASPELAKAFLHLLAQTGQLERFQAFFAKTQSQPQADGVAAFAVETLLAEKEAALAITVGESLFSKAPRGKHAFLIAQGYAQSNNEAETLRWLDQAKDKGFEVKERLPHLPEFAFLADHPAFQRFR